MKIFLTMILLMITTNLFAETNPPKVTTQQFQNWTYQCVEDKKRKSCEVSQNIRIQNSNINFSVGNAFLSAHRFFPYQTQQNEIDRLFKDEYPLYYNSENRYEFNLELAKNGSSTKITI